MNQQDFKRMAERTKRYGELLIERAEKALDTAASWKNESGVYNPPDPEGGEGRDKLDRLDPLRHRRLLAHFARMDAELATGTWLMLDTVPREPDKALPHECPEGACRSCWRDGNYFEPEALHPDGSVKYKGLCRWCGGINGTFGAWPPKASLKKHHESRRVSVRELVDEFKAEGRTLTAEQIERAKAS